jgi:hypothetical protein
MLKQKIELMLSTKEVTKVMRIQVASISLEQPNLRQKDR